MRASERGTIAASDAIEFFGTGQDTLHTDSRTYWLTWGTGRIRRVRAVAAAGNGTSGATSFPYAVTRMDRGMYVASVHNGDRDNFYGAIVMGWPVEQAIAVPHPDLSETGTATVSVLLQGFSSIHAVAVALNGHPLGVPEWTGLSPGAASYTVPASWLAAGENIVRLTGASDEDASAVESIRIDYPHTYDADDALLCASQGGVPQVIRGFPNDRVRLVAVTDPDHARELVGTAQPEGAGFSVWFTAPGEGPRSVLAFTDDRAVAPAAVQANRPSSWRAAANAGAVVMIAHAKFASALEPLRARRAAQHGSAVIVDVEDLYDEFNFGAKSPQAILDFLAAAAGWRVPPRFVLLVGDSTFDPRNFAQDYLEGPIDFDFVPSRLVDTTELETASDDWYTDSDGDGAADLPIGRLPVRTAEEAGTIVAKLLGYEDGPADTSWTRKAVFVSDYRDGDTDFAAHAVQAASALPADFTKIQLAADTLGAGGARSQLLSELGAGAGLAAFFGHASQEMWSASGILFGDDANGLTGPRLPVNGLDDLPDRALPRPVGGVHDQEAPARARRAGRALGLHRLLRAGLAARDGRAVPGSPERHRSEHVRRGRGRGEAGQCRA